MPLKRSFIILSSLLLSAHALANQKELARYSKCHALFVSERAEETDPRWIAVKNGAKTGTQACMELLNKANLDGYGEIQSGTSRSGHDDQGVKILRNFLLFYKSQFKVPDYSVRISAADSRTIDVIDSNESAYHILYSLFKSNETYSNILTRNYGLKGKRYSQKSTRYRSISSTRATELFNATNATEINRCKNILKLRCDREFATPLNANLRKGCNERFDDSVCHFYTWQGQAANYFDEVSNTSTFIPDLASTKTAEGFIADPVETGILVGLEPENRDNHNTYNNPWAGSEFTNMNGHYGAGILGTQSYIMGNLTTFSYTALNGGTKVQRRYGEHVLSDFLCRPNPTLRSIDIMSEVTTNSTIPFRQGISCMRCHSGMDPLGGVARGFAYHLNTNRNVGRIAYIGQLDLNGYYASTGNANRRLLWAETGGSTALNFYRGVAPTGRLFYRGYDGSLIKEDIENIEHLGEAIIEKNDFYACAAKRHFKFLTGIDVNLDDSGDINFPSLSKTEKKYRDRVIELGQDLRNHQSLKELLRAIIQSDTFIYPDQGV